VKVKEVASIMGTNPGNRSPCIASRMVKGLYEGMLESTDILFKDSNLVDVRVDQAVFFFNNQVLGLILFSRQTTQLRIVIEFIG